MSSQDMFNAVASSVPGVPEGNAKPRPSGEKAPSPFTIRLTPEERAYLEEQAGNRPLSVYVRGLLLGDKAHKRRVSRKPAMDDTQYAALLGALGQSHLSSNLNQLAKHANMGTLDVSQEVEQQLQEAYQAIIAMRQALFAALRVEQGDKA